MALELDEHLERINGKELPLAWATFREHATRRCKDAGEAPQLHPNAERFLRDLLLRLRAGPAANPDSTSSVQTDLFSIQGRIAKRVILSAAPAAAPAH